MARLKTLSTCACGTQFHPWNVRQQWCSRPCWLRKHNETPRMSEETARKIGDALRDRGEGKGYRKRRGRHEHRVVAEAMLGRPLQKGEVVHHLDNDKRNNNPANLRVFSSQAEHARFHKENP